MRIPVPKSQVVARGLNASRLFLIFVGHEIMNHRDGSEAQGGGDSGDMKHFNVDILYSARMRGTEINS